MKIIIVSGFLGAGKTRFIKTLAENTNKNFVILENEFGDTNLDGEYLRKNLPMTSNEELKIWELTQGCICCSVNLDLNNSILTIANTLNPDYLVIEPSGVAKVSNIVGKIKKIAYERIELGAIIAIIDAYNYKKDLRENKEYIEDYLKNSSQVVVSKAENFTKEEFLEIKKELMINEGVKYPLEHYSKWSKEKWEKIFNTELKVDKTRLVFTFKNSSVSRKSFEQLSFTEIGMKNIDELANSLLYLMSKRVGEIDRVKGNLTLAEASYKFDLVGENYIITGNNEKEENKVIIIGKNLNKSALEKIFKV